MGISRSLSLGILILLLSVSTVSGETEDDYRFEILPDGTPSYSQIIRWEPNPDVLYYEIVLRDNMDRVISVSTCEEPEVSLHLPPGKYSYQIRLYNLLGNLELVLPFWNLTVLRAELPEIDDISPPVWYMEDLKTMITISGMDLMPGAEVLLRPKLFPTQIIRGVVTENRENRVITVKFPDRDVDVQSYTLEWTNPGGLSLELPDGVRVGYLKPVDVLMSAGAAPWLGLYDSWYRENWSRFCYPLGGVSRLSFYFLKRTYGYFGLEMEFGAINAPGGIPSATIETLILNMGLNALYKYPVGRELFLGARLGAGCSRYDSRFDYKGTSGAEMTSYDPYFGAGILLQFFFTKKLFLESGMDWRHVLRDSFTEGGLSPFLSAGLRL